MPSISLAWQLALKGGQGQAGDRKTSWGMRRDPLLLFQSSSLPTLKVIVNNLIWSTDWHILYWPRTWLYRPCGNFYRSHTNCLHWPHTDQIDLFTVTFSECNLIIVAFQILLLQNHTLYSVASDCLTLQLPCTWGRFWWLCAKKLDT